MADANLDAMIDDLSVWVRTESPTDAPDAVNRMMDLVVAAAEAPGIPCERLAGQQGLGDTLILRAGPHSDRPGVLVLAHLDTVHPLGMDRSRCRRSRREPPPVLDERVGQRHERIEDERAASRGEPRGRQVELPRIADDDGVDVARAAAERQPRLGGRKPQRRPPARAPTCAASTPTPARDARPPRRLPAAGTRSPGRCADSRARTCRSRGPATLAKDLVHVRAPRCARRRRAPRGGS